MLSTAQDCHKKMQDVWTKALRDVQGPEAKAAYRLFLWLLDNGIKISYADLQAIRGELAMFQSNPSENWKSNQTFHDMLGFQRNMFSHNANTTTWLDKLYYAVQDHYQSAWTEPGSRTLFLRYHIALDIFEYAANAEIAHVSKLISESLAKLEEIRIEHEKHGRVRPCIFRRCKNDS